MTRLLRWLGRLAALLALFAVLLLSPVAYVEFACTAPETAQPYEPIISDPAWQREAGRTLTTYPEWHIVHAYDDYARVIQDGDPHDFGFLRAISGFWTTLCPLKAQAERMGGMGGDSKATIYTIGVSFTVEMLAKATYEEIFGRIATLIRGDERARLDEVSADQAAKYAEFLQQTPWYKWDFGADALELERESRGSFRDRERIFALGAEFGAKGWYAAQIDKAVAGMGGDKLRMRSVVTGIDATALSQIDGVNLVEELPEGSVIETDRYRAFTRIAERLAEAGGDFVEIAGNDVILFTALSDEANADGALFSFARQGYDDTRHLILVPVRDLAARLRGLEGLRLEHVHDY